jgi:asparagine synthase (glutamine-hydrolysing)
MIRPLVPHPWFVTERCESLPGAALAAVSLDRAGRQPHVAADDAAAQTCVLDGEFYNARELAPALPTRVQQELGAVPSDAELLLAGWRHEGLAFLRRINGSFSAVLWDADRREATFVTDRFGNRPLYYMTAGSRLLVSSRLKSFTADPEFSLDIDPRGMAQFFTFGHYLGEHTSLAAARVFPAAAAWTWHANRGAWTKRTYHTWAEAYDLAFSSPKEWIGAIGDAFGRAVERQTASTPNLGLSLSGGLDARTILAAIDVRRTPLTTVCLGIAGSLDHRCAQRLAEIAGCTNHSHVLDTEFLRDFRRHLEWMVQLTDGQYLSQCIVMPTLPLYRRLGIDVLLRGHAGELMHMYKAYNYSLDEEALALSGGEQLQAWLFKRLSAYMLDGVSQPLFAGELWTGLADHARASLAGDIAATAAADPPAQQIWQLFLTQRLRRETVLSLNEFRSVAETRLPILDNELVALLLAAPPALKLGEEIQAALLQRFRPEFLKVVNANTGTHVGAGPLRRKLSSLKRRVLAKLGLPGYQPYERLGLWLKRELRGLVSDILLDPRTLDRGLYRPDALRTVVANHQAGQANHTYLLMALMIFELGQRYLEQPLEGVKDAAPPLAAAGVVA